MARLLTSLALILATALTFTVPSHASCDLDRDLGRASEDELDLYLACLQEELSVVQQEVENAKTPPVDSLYQLLSGNAGDVDSESTVDSDDVMSTANFLERDVIYDESSETLDIANQEVVDYDVDDFSADDDVTVDALTLLPSETSMSDFPFCRRLRVYQCDILLGFLSDMVAHDMPTPDMTSSLRVRRGALVNPKMRKYVQRLIKKWGAKNKVRLDNETIKQLIKHYKWRKINGAGQVTARFGRSVADNSYEQSQGNGFFGVYNQQRAEVVKAGGLPRGKRRFSKVKLTPEMKVMLNSLRKWHMEHGGPGKSTSRWG